VSSSASSSADASPRAIPTLGTLLGLAWPIVISRATQVVIGVSDAVMVAGLGKAALAATTTGALNAFSVLILPMGIVFIVSTFSSQLFARGDLAGARRYGFYGLAVAIATQLLCFGGLALRERVLAWFPYQPEVRQLIADYLLYRLASGGAAIGMEALANYYGGLGKTRVPMLASVAAMVLNVFANWVLIGGHLGAPALGVKGAALANTICTTIAFAGLLAKFLLDGRAARAVLPRLHLAELGRMLRFGLPSGLNWFFEFFAFLVFVNVVMAGLGTTSLAAMMAVFQVNSLSFMPAFGLASAGAILVGQAIGAGAKDEVPRIVRLTFAAAGTWQGAVGLAYIAIPGLLFGVFTSGAGDDGSLRAAGVRMLMFSAAWQLFDAAAGTLAEALRAAGDTAFTLWARLVLAWAIFTPGAFVTVRYFGWGDRGAVFWLVLYLALLAGVLWLRFRTGAWRRIRLTEHAPPV
jgi:MATE family multidrug resistance protein